MSTKNAFKATYHYYLTDAILKEIAKSGEVVGDLFGIGEDTFVTHLYPYSNLLYRCISNETDKSDLEWKESDLFELVSKLAECFLAIALRDEPEMLSANMPDIHEFELDIQRILAIA